MASDEHRIKSVERAFNIVEQVGKMDGGRVGEVADQMDIPKSTAYVHLETLQEIGYLDKETDEYHVSLRFLQPGGRARQRLRIYRISKGHVDRLASETGFHSGLAVENNCKRLILYTSEGEEDISNIYSRLALVGTRLPMNWTATGKSMLAAMDEKQLDRTLSEEGLVEATSNTITDREELSQQLAGIRERGYAVEDEEFQIGSRAIAASLSDPAGPLGAIAIAGPKEHLTTEKIEGELAPSLMEHANLINLQLEAPDFG